MQRILIHLQQTPVASFIFLVTLASSIACFRNPELMAKLSLRPFAFARGERRYMVISSGLIHGDLQHLIFNMLTFYFFAFSLEHSFLWLNTLGIEAGNDEEQNLAEILGHAKFFVFYFACMVMADLTTILKYKDIPSYSAVGASGALSGVVVSMIILAPASGHGLSQLMIFGIIPGWAFAVIYIAGSYIASRRGMMGKVAHEAHLWGALAGIVMSIAMYPKACWEFVLSVGKWMEMFQ